MRHGLGVPALVFLMLACVLPTEVAAQARTPPSAHEQMPEGTKTIEQELSGMKDALGDKYDRVRAICLRDLHLCTAGKAYWISEGTSQKLAGSFDPAQGWTPLAILLGMPAGKYVIFAKIRYYPQPFQSKFFCRLLASQSLDQVNVVSKDDNEVRTLGFDVLAEFSNSGGAVLGCQSQSGSVIVTNARIIAVSVSDFPPGLAPVVNND